MLRTDLFFNIGSKLTVGSVGGAENTSDICKRLVALSYSQILRFKPLQLFTLLFQTHMISGDTKNEEKFSWQKRSNIVMMHVKASSVLLVNVANLHDQLEADVKSA